MIEGQMSEEQNNIEIAASVKRVKALIRDVSEDWETVVQGAEIVLEIPLISEKDLRRFERANIYEHLVMISMCQPELIPEPETAPAEGQIPIRESAYTPEAGSTSDTPSEGVDVSAAFYGRRGYPDQVRITEINADQVPDAPEAPAPGAIRIGTPVRIDLGSGRLGVVKAEDKGLWQVSCAEMGDLGLYVPELLKAVFWCEVHERPYDPVGVDNRPAVQCQGCVADEAEKAQAEARPEQDKFAHPQNGRQGRGKRNG